MDPVSKAAVAAGKPLIQIVAEWWKRQRARSDASPLANVDFASVDKQLDEALDTLLGDAQTLREWIPQRLRALVSERPKEFEDEDARTWLRTDVRRTVKEAVLTLVAGEEIGDQRQRAAARYAELTGDTYWHGGTLFDFAVSFLSLTLGSLISIDTRLLLAVTKRSTSRISSEIGDVGNLVQAGTRAMSARIDEVLEKLEGSTFPADVVGRQILDEVARENRSLFLGGGDRIIRILSVADRLLSGDLDRAPADAKIAAFRLAGATLARADRPDEAEPWIDAAEAAGAQDLAVDRARVALRRADYPAALRLLEGRHDRAALPIYLEVIRKRDGNGAAINYYEKHLTPADLTGYMICSMADWLGEEGKWDAACALIASPTPQQIGENPLLPLTAARVRMAALAPQDQRRVILDNVSAMPRPEDMRTDAVGRKLLDEARADLALAAQLIKPLESPAAEVIVDSQRIYMDLLAGDPTAEERLSAKLADFTTVIDFAWIAIDREIAFDTSVLKDKLERRKALEGWDSQHLLTAFHLVRHLSDDGAEIVRFVEDNRAELLAAAPPGLIFGVEIEALARQGRIAEGRQRLNEAQNLLEPDISSRMRLMLDEQEGGNPMALRLARFEETDADVDLQNLLGALMQAKDERVAEYSAELWRRRRQVEDAIRACNYYFNSGRDGPLDALLVELGEAVEDDPRLIAHAAWAQFRAGDVAGAEAKLAPLRVAQPDDPSLRQLKINISLESGDWHRLGPLFREDLDHRQHRTATQLLQSASIAHTAGDPLADDLMRAGADAAGDDPGLLLQAYGQAIQRGSDWSEEAGGWFKRAVELSGEEGPVQSKKLADLIAMQREYMTRGHEIDDMVMKGDVPLVMAAKPLGTTLSELILGRLAANVTLEDARQRLCLPFVAGNRLRVDMTGVNTIGLDPNAILALQLCGLLEATLDCFDQVVIPSGTLPLVFNDLSRADRSQPSRVEQALRIRALEAEGRLKVLPAHSDGEPIEFLHAQAARLGGAVAHSAPLWVPNSLMEDKLDPTPFQDRLVSGSSILAALERMGEIGAEEADGATKRMGALGNWPAEPRLDLDQPLVVDLTTLHALDDANLLEPLLRAGTQLHVSQTAIQVAESGIRQRRDAQALSGAIEGVRRSLRLALVDGKARIGAFQRDAAGLDDEPHERMEREVETAPILALLQDGSGIDVLVSADRMINRNGHFTDRSGIDRPVLTIVDVIDHLARKGKIDQSRRRAAMRKLRQAGVGMVPVDAEDILAAATEGDWSHGPGRSLRAIRDSIHLPLIRRALRLPDDRHWLEQSVMALTIAIRRFWNKLEPEAAAAASSFIFDIIPNLDAIPLDDNDPSASVWADNVMGGSHALLAVAMDMPGERIEQYHEWYGQVVAPRLRGRDARLMVDVSSRLCRVVSSIDPAQRNDTDGAPDIQRMGRVLATLIPEMHHESLNGDAMVRAALGFAPDTMIVDEIEVSVDALSAYFAATLEGTQSQLLAADGEVFANEAEVNDDGSVTVLRPESRIRFEMAGLFSNDRQMRVRTFDTICAEHTIGPSSAAKWRVMIEFEPLAPSLMPVLGEELRCTPEVFASTFQGRSFTLDDLGDLNSTQLSTILDMPDRAASLPEAVRRVSAAHAAGPSLPWSAQTVAPLAICPDFDFPGMIQSLNTDDALDVCRTLHSHGDAFSLLAGFQTACARLKEKGFVPLGDAILEYLFGKGGQLDDVSHDFAVAARVALAAEDTVHVLPGLPLSQRRCTLLAHAGTLARVLHGREFDRKSLLETARKYNMIRFVMGGLADRIDSSLWIRDWLGPIAVKAYLIRRLYEAMEPLEEALRPKRWTELFESLLSKDSDVDFLPFLALPGPLDPFCDSPGISEPLDVKKAVEILVENKDGKGIEYIHIWNLVSDAPSDPASLVQPIVNLVEKASDADRRRAYETVLITAARWRSPELAERIVSLMMSHDEARNSLMPLTCQSLFAAAAAEADDDAAREKVRAQISDLAFGKLDRLSAGTLQSFIEMLSDIVPAWAPNMERMRSAAMLAS